MSMGTGTIQPDELKMMQSFFPGDSLYLFVQGEQLKGSDNTPKMLHIQAAGYLFTMLSRFCFTSKEDAIRYLEDTYESHPADPEQ